MIPIQEFFDYTALYTGNSCYNETRYHEFHSITNVPTRRERTLRHRNSARYNEFDVLYNEFFFAA
jgi:hypothetical protein